MSGNSLRAALICGFAFLPLGGHAAPNRDGMDWVAGRLGVLGVGTPRLLSPTGSLLLEDATVLAQDHARRRLAEALLALPAAGGDTRGALAAAAQRVAGLVRFGEPRAFSDGTIHLPAEVDVASALGHGTPAPEPDRTVAAPAGFTPCIRLLPRSPAGTTSLAGFPGDPTPHLRCAEPGAPSALAIPTAAAPDVCVLVVEGAAPRSLRVVLPGPPAAPPSGGR